MGRNLSVGRLVFDTPLFSDTVDPRPLTLHFWFRPRAGYNGESFDQSGRFVFNNVVGGGVVSFTFVVNHNGGNNFRIVTGGTETVFPGAGAILTEVWNSIAICWLTNGTLQVYVNGVVAGTSTLAWVGNGQTGGSVFGGLQPGGVGQWDADYGEIATYNSVLSPAQIASLAAGNGASIVGSPTHYARILGTVLPEPVLIGTGSYSVNGTAPLATPSPSHPTISFGPSISAIAPISGRATGTTVTLTVNNSAGCTGIAVNGVALTNFVIVNGTTISGVTSNATTGAVTATNANGVGTGPTFTVVPVATAIRFVGGGAAPWAPDTGPIEGVSYTFTLEAWGGTARDTLIAGNCVIGTDFVAGANVVVSAGPSSVAWSSGLAVFTNTVFAAGVTPPAAPTLTSYSPSSGLVGTQVTITGTNMTNSTGATIYGIALTAFSVINATTAFGIIPTGAITGAITLLNANGNAIGPVFTVSAVVTPPVTPPVGPVIVNTQIAKFTTVPVNQTSNVNFTTALIGEITNLAGVRQTTYVTPVTLVMQSGNGSLIGAAVVTPVAGVFTFPANSVGARLLFAAASSVTLSLLNVAGASAPISITTPAPVASLIASYIQVPSGRYSEPEIVFGVTGPVAGGTLFVEASFNELDWFPFDLISYAGAITANLFTAAFSGHADSNGVNAVRVRKSVDGVTFVNLTLNVAGM